MFVVWFSYSCSSLTDEWCPDSLVHVVAANDPGHRELHRLAPQSSEAIRHLEGASYKVLRQGKVTNKAARLGSWDNCTYLEEVKYPYPYLLLT